MCAQFQWSSSLSLFTIESNSLSPPSPSFIVSLLMSLNDQLETRRLSSFEYSASWFSTLFSFSRISERTLAEPWPCWSISSRGHPRAVVEEEKSIDREVKPETITPKKNSIIINTTIEKETLLQISAQCQRQCHAAKHTHRICRISRTRHAQCSSRYYLCSRIYIYICVHVSTWYHLGLRKHKRKNTLMTAIRRACFGSYTWWSLAARNK